MSKRVVNREGNRFCRAGDNGERAAFSRLEFQKHRRGKVGELLNKSLVCTFVSSNEVKVISVRKSNDWGAVKQVAMSRFSFKKVNDRVKAEDKD